MFSTTLTDRSGGSSARPLRARAASVAVALALVITGSLVSAHSATAASYPSWDDVQAAQASSTAKAAEITRLQSVLSQLQSAADSAQADATKKGNELQEAQQKFAEAASKADTLKAQADAASAKAKSSQKSAGAMAAQLARSGDSAKMSAMFFDGGSAKSLLDQLSLASKVTDQSKGLYEKAIQQRNSAEALTKQSDVAKTAIKVLADDAQSALDSAQAASEAATAAVAEQSTHQAELQAQLASLQNNTRITQAQYNAGVAAAAKAAAAAAATPVKSPSGGSGSTPAGSAPVSSAPVTASGWVRPAGGHITSPYGWRVNPATGVYALHAGTDLGNSCGSPIYAAHAGKVTYTGVYGGYGNFVQIANNDGTGVSTAYGHIIDGGTLVSIGQTVSAGQQIAKVGSTGQSTGCHLHFEVRVNNVPEDAVPFMRARGVELAN
jgi:murein DD-endopeptidase MepM/ murein hydrolase activator NlpD